MPVIPLPNRLEWLAAGIKDDIAAAESSNTVWIDHMVNAAIKTAEARGAYTSDIAFGQWWTNHALPLNKNDRAALTAMGKLPEEMRRIFHATDRRSLQLVYKTNKDRFPSTRKPRRIKTNTTGTTATATTQAAAHAAPTPVAPGTTVPPPKQNAAEAGDDDMQAEPPVAAASGRSRRGLSTPRLDQARAIIRRYLDANEPVNPHKLQEIHGISHVTFDMAITAELAVREAAEPQIDINTFAPTTKAKLEMWKRQETRRLNAEHAQRMAQIDEEIRRQVVERGAQYREQAQAREAEARKTEASFRRLINNRQFAFTTEQFRAILACLHPDSVNQAGERTVTVERLNTAFSLFRAKRLQLTGEEDVRQS
jgi:hypothetical protein